MDNSEIAGRIKKARKERGLTQSDIASILNKSSATVSDIERGKIQVSAADLYKISTSLNKPIEWFFGKTYGDEEFNDLIFLIRNQSPEQHEQIINLTKSLIALQKFQFRVDNSNQEISDEEIKEAVNYIFSYTDEIEKIYFQMMEIRKGLRDLFKSHGLDDDYFSKSIKNSGP